MYPVFITSSQIDGNMYVNSLYFHDSNLLIKISNSSLWEFLLSYLYTIYFFRTNRTWNKITNIVVFDRQPDRDIVY